MKKSVVYVAALTVALLIIAGNVIVSDFQPATVAFAQDATVAPATGAQTAQPTQPVEREDNGFPWGLLGLLGLGGLAGLRRPEPVRQEPTQTTPRGASSVGVYNDPKK